MIERKDGVLIPDQVLTSGEVLEREYMSIFHGCPGYGDGGDDSPSNWPPKRGVITRLRERIKNIRKRGR